MRGDEDDATLDGGGAVGHGFAGGDGCGDLEGEEAFAGGVVAVEEGDTGKGDAARPEPLEWLRLDVGEFALVGGEWVALVGDGGILVVLGHGVFLLCDRIGVSSDISVFYLFFMKICMSW
jgi:hypothetical protein